MAKLLTDNLSTVMSSTSKTPSKIEQIVLALQVGPQILPGHIELERLVDLAHIHLVDVLVGLLFGQVEGKRHLVALFVLIVDLTNRNMSRSKKILTVRLRKQNMK